MGFFDAGEADIESAEGVGEARVVDAQDVEHRGVEVSEVDRALRRCCTRSRRCGRIRCLAGHRCRLLMPRFRFPWIHIRETY
jgi:hypothetical protein